MRKCPHCAEEIQDGAIKCKHCGGVVVGERWRAFCEGYVKMTQQQRQAKWESLSDEQKTTLRAALSALGFQPRAAAKQPAPKKKTSPWTMGCLVLIILFGLLYVVDLASNGGSYPSSSSRIPGGDADEWFDGGTLHNRTMAEWSRASYRDRLATSADFFATSIDSRSEPPRHPDRFRGEAIELEVCISETHAEGITDSQRVSEIAAACLILLGYT